MEIWKSSLANRSEGTRKQYLHYFNNFINFVGRSPDELREMKYLEDQESKPWERNRVENLLREHFKTLEEKEFTCSTQNLALASIRSFFEAQGMPLFLKREDKPTGCAFGSKAMTPEEIRQTKNAAEHLRDKALIMFLKDSGLRQSDAAKLRWKDFKDYGDDFWGFQIQTKKKGIKARGFIGSEASDMLKIYKRKRSEGTKKLDPEENIEENPVFALFSDPTKVVKPDSMSGIIGSIISLAKIENASAHGFRKFWEQNMHVEHEAYQKQMNGRALDSVERAYYWKETEDLFELYRNNYHNLRIEQSDFKEAEERIRRDYEREISILKKELEQRERRLDERDRQFNDTMKKLEPLTKFVEFFEDPKEMELFSKMLVTSGEVNTGYPEELGYDEDRVQDLLEHVNPVLGKLLLLNALKRKREADKKQEGE